MDIIVAVDSGFGIGLDGGIPWTDTLMGREDMAYFWSMTHGDRVIMGRRTWESLPRRPLPGRENVVLTAANIDTFAGARVVKSLTDASDGWIIGGEGVYRAALESGRVRRLYITYIDKDYGCDTHFPIATLFARSATRLESCQRIEYSITTTTIRVYRMIVAVGNEPPSIMGESGYLSLMRDIINGGEHRDTRNARTRSLFARSLTFSLATFPLLTTKTVFLRGVFEELMMFIRGETNTRALSSLGVRIWEPNTSAAFLASRGLAYGEGDMGPMYGYNWRHFGRAYDGMNMNVNASASMNASMSMSTSTSASMNASMSMSTSTSARVGGFDQLAYCLDLIARDPASRRIIMTTYNPAVAHEGVLYPCHGISIQFHVSTDRQLSCAMTQRSGDVFLGVPFNIASYALLVYLICAHLNRRFEGPMRLRPGRLTINFGDVHLYEQHIDAAYLQLLRSPGHAPPRLEIGGDHEHIEDYVWGDIRLSGYISDDRIRAEMIA